MSVDSSAAQSIVDANADVIETFVSKYLLDNGIGVQLIEVVAKELFGQQVNAGSTISDGSTPADLIKTALRDIVEVSLLGSVTYSLENVIDGAASFELLVRYAYKIDPRILPSVVIPSEEVVWALIQLFHASRQETASDAETAS